MIKIEQYTKSKKGNSIGDSKLANTIINSYEGSSFEPHRLWGQYFDDTKDIKGDLKEVGNIYAKGNIEGDSININNASVTGNIKSDSITSKKGDIENITSKQIDTNSLNVKESLEAVKATIKTILGGDITVENLTVTKQAHLFKLIIDEMKSVGGILILTQANCKIDKVEKQINGDYRCYWKSSDGKRSITNQWLTQDQAICMTFNANQYKYYWRLVNGVGTTKIDDADYHYIDLSDSIKDGSSIPSVGDELSQLGYRGNDLQRQSAIILSAYKSPDATVEAPSLVQYKGINEFNLSNHQYNVIAANGNKFRGDFKVENGETIQQYIEEKAEDNAPYIKDEYWWVNNKNTGVKVSHSGYRVEAFSTAGSTFFGEGGVDQLESYLYNQSMV